jgi:tetratricopeptide (TPR) repeat protein
LTAIGSTLNELGNYLGAISFYKKALEIDPHHVGALTGIGATLDLLGICKDTSVAYFKEALAHLLTIMLENLSELWLLPI